MQDRSKMQDESVMDQIADIAGCFVAVVTGAQIIYAAFRTVSRFLPGREVSPSTRMAAGESTEIDFGLQHAILPSHRLMIHSRSVQI